MSALAAIVFLLAAPAIQVQVAPDQPVPYVYVDDPLIVEFRAQEDATVSAKVEVARTGVPPTTTDLGTIRLRAKGVQWRAVDGIPVDLGLYRITFKLDVAGQPLDIPATFCRIARPFSGVELPFSLRVGDLNAQTLRVVQGIPLRSVRLDAASSELENQIRAASAAGLQVAVGLDAQTLSDPAAQAQDLATRLGDKVKRWEIDPTGAIDRLANVAAGLRQGNSRAPIGLTAYSTGDLSALLHAAAQYDVSGVIFRHPAPTLAELNGFRSAVEQAGYEGMPIALLTKGRPEGQPVQGAALAKQLLTYRAADVARTELEDVPVYDVETGLSEACPYLSAIAHRLRDASPVGSLSLGSGISAPVFRLADTWIVALWTDGGPREILVPVGKATDLQLANAMNNPVAVPAASDSGITLTIGPEPVYLIGHAGNVLNQAAATQIRTEAEVLLTIPAFSSTLPSEMSTLLENLAKTNTGKIERGEFFALLGLFPYIEQQWHSAHMARATAGPALAGLTRLARALCVIEEEEGDSFVAPFKAIVANSSEAQSVYLTNSGGKPSSDRRGDWILAVVSRLLADAERLNDEGRTNEAKAIATLAEWRARALEIAAKAAPLTDPEPAVVVPVSMPTPETKAKTQQDSDQPKESVRKKSSASESKTKTTSSKRSTRSRRTNK